MENRDGTRDDNADRDPISVALGARPVGTGVGAAAAGAAAGTVAGTVGTLVGWNRVSGAA